MSTTGKLTITPELLARLGITERQLLNFITKWKITELALFGSILRDDFGPKSDVDFLALFAPESQWTLFDKERLREELSKLIHRDIDMVSKRAIERSRNPYRRESILTTSRVIYVS